MPSAHVSPFRHASIALTFTLVLATIPALAAGQLPLREQCAQLKKRVPLNDGPAYAATVASVDKLTSALLAEGIALRAEVLAAMKTGFGDDSWGLFDMAWGRSLRSKIAALNRVYWGLTERFLRYDRDVSECVRHIGTGWETELFTRLEFALRAQQVSGERDTVRNLLDSLKATIGSVENDRNTRIARTVAVLSVLLTCLTLVLVGFQIALAKAQNRLVREQVDITKRQDALNREVLSRRPDLSLRINDADDSLALTDPPYQLTFSVFNAGNKGARGFYNTVSIPTALQLATRDSYFGNLSRAAEREINGVPYSIFQNYVENPAFPQRATRIGDLLLTGPEGEYTLLWQISTDGGLFPSSGQLGRFTLRTQRPGE